MNVYVESNFVLQLALLQEVHASCEAILQLCEAGGAQLVIPAVCLVEPDQMLYRQKQRRTQIKVELDREFQQLARTSPYAARRRRLHRKEGGRTPASLPTYVQR